MSGFEKDIMSSLEEFDHLKIPLEDIKEATNNFSKENCILLGDGIFYKGVLSRPTGMVTSVFKRLYHRYGQGDSVIWKEVRILSTYKHENLVSFVGYCNEGDKEVLVYEFLARGHLAKYLSSAELPWLMRLQICLGVARGLNYLHDSRGTLVHRDIKSANILLDENWHAKLFIFGVIHGSADVSNAIGTDGYRDPFYMETGVLTKESNIYSFGVVLFEVLCGRPAVTGHRDDKQFLSKWVIHNHENGTLTDIIPPILRKQMNQYSLDIFSTAAYQCLAKNPEKRPSIHEIMQKLEEALGLQLEFEKASSVEQGNSSVREKYIMEPVKTSLVREKYIMEPVKISLEDIKFATADFHDNFIIKQGGFGKLYKADIFHFVVENNITDNTFPTVSMDELSSYPRRQTTVAIKRLDRRYGKGSAEFLEEISMFPYSRHKNLVKLVGFCDEDDECILVYEYASNGSLDEYICSAGGVVILTWATRLQICLDAAHGLNFLHNDVKKHHRSIHGNVKSSNILLDGNWRGMISDFAFSRTDTKNLQTTFLMTQAAGTLEYIDPLYHKTGILTKESDVYSFGVILFEVLSGRLANFYVSQDNPEFVPHMAKRCFEQKNLHEIIDPKLKEEFEKVKSFFILTIDRVECPRSINVFAAIAYKCIQEKQCDRPTMAEVVKELKRALKYHVESGWELEFLKISLNKIIFATNEFSVPFEQGAFGKVYKGALSVPNGYKWILVMRIDPSHMVGLYEKEFCKAIQKLYSYSHKNVIPLIGFCEESSERILVFEDMVNGSLKQHLRNPSLTWKKRLRICVDAARGLAYIHGDIIEKQHLIHGHINSNNILLNHNWEAVISDFIISKGAETLGYYDPFYARTGIRTQKSDVYSFGVVLFEILSGRSAIETLQEDAPNVELENRESGVGEDGQVVFLALLAAQCFENKRLEEIIFHDIKGQIDAKTLDIFSTIAYQCLQEQPKDRPTMVEVVKELEKAFEYQNFLREIYR